MELKISYFPEKFVAPIKFLQLVNRFRFLFTFNNKQLFIFIFLHIIFFNFFYGLYNFMSRNVIGIHV